MATLPKHACSHGGCSVLVEHGKCERHVTQAAADWDMRRGTAHQRGYGRKWGRTRGDWLNRHALCCDPWDNHGRHLEPASVVDHWIPRSAGGADDESNYASMCETCHNIKRGMESRGIIQRAEDRPEPG